MQAYRLIPHPSADPFAVTSIEVRIRLDDPHWVRMRWRIENAAHLTIPPIRGKQRADQLWEMTCFEMFVRPEGGPEYIEWNFSPSRRWNSYAFSEYRQGMRQWDVAHPPDTVWHGGRNFALFDVAIARKTLPDGQLALGLSAVIEEEGGIKSYWALAHADAERPDFHHSACFAATLDPRLQS